MKAGTLVLIGLAAALLALDPLAAQTQRPEHAREGHRPSVSAPTSASASARAGRDEPKAMLLSAPRAVQVGGLAVGDRLDPAHLHVITRPGLYGLSGQGEDNHFGIVDGMLVRFDPDNLRLRSIIRTGVTAAD